MMTIIHGTTEVKGEVEGFTPGSASFEIDFGNGGKFLIEAKSGFPSDTFDKIRVSMNAIGLLRLKNSIIDFNKGKIELIDGPAHTPKPRNNISSAFIS